jgi:hypothetical protein
MIQPVAPTPLGFLRSYRTESMNPCVDPTGLYLQESWCEVTLELAACCSSLGLAALRLDDRRLRIRRIGLWLHRVKQTQRSRPIPARSLSLVQISREDKPNLAHLSPFSPLVPRLRSHVSSLCRVALKHVRKRGSASEEQSTARRGPADSRISSRG